MFARQSNGRLDNLLSLGARDQDGRIDEKVEAPKFLMARDVLRGLAVEALAQVAAVVNPFDLSQFALAVCVKMRPVTTRGVH